MAQGLSDSLLQFALDMYGKLQSQNKGRPEHLFLPVQHRPTTHDGSRRGTQQHRRTTRRPSSRQKRSEQSSVQCHEIAQTTFGIRAGRRVSRGQPPASKIRDLLPPGSVGANTTLLLLNAIYFKGFWSSPFTAHLTKPHDFHLDSENVVKVDTMSHAYGYKISTSKELRARALEMPYRGGKMSMVILLPDEVEGLPFLEKAPYLKIERGLALKDVLRALGVVDLFKPEVADLSGIFESGKPAVTDILHKTWTIPFMFIIKTNEPDVILFVGSVWRP
ncbi:hypothetical protein MRX96_008049 [Rhipicephalus microplus]